MADMIIYESGLSPTWTFIAAAGWAPLSWLIMVAWQWYRQEGDLMAWVGLGVLSIGFVLVVWYLGVLTEVRLTEDYLLVARTRGSKRFDAAQVLSLEEERSRRVNSSIGLRITAGDGLTASFPCQPLCRYTGAEIARRFGLKRVTGADQEYARWER